MIRLANIKDLIPLAALFEELHLHHVKLEPDKYRIPRKDFFETEMRNFLEDDEEQVVCHITCGKIDGYAVFTVAERNRTEEFPKKTLFVRHFAVTERFRHKGIGRELMEYLKNAAFDNGCDNIRLGVNALNKTAVTFYGNVGFEPQTFIMEMRIR